MNLLTSQSAGWRLFGDRSEGSVNRTWFNTGITPGILLLLCLAKPPSEYVTVCLQGKVKSHRVRWTDEERDRKEIGGISLTY